MASEAQSWNPPSGTAAKAKYVLLAVGPMAVLVSASMGPGSISSLVVAGSELGYTALWLPLLSGWLAAAVHYTSGKVTSITNQTPVEVVSRYSHPIISILLFVGLIMAWYFVVVIEGFLLLSTTLALAPALEPFIVPVVALQILLIAAIFTGGFDVVKGVLSALVVGLATIFLINAVQVGPDAGATAAGLLPTEVPPGLAQVGFAGIVGGSIGVGPIWYAYLAKDNGWGERDLPFMAWDQITFHGILFGLFSVGIYLSAAATLQGTEVAGELDAAQALEPIAGSLAAFLFTLGLWAAVFTTIGGMSAIGAYVIGDILNNVPGLGADIELSLDSPVIRAVTGLGIVFSGLGITFERQPPLQLMAEGVALLTHVAPVFIAVFTIAVIRRGDLGGRVGPWYLVVGLVAAFLVTLYSSFLTGVALTAVGLVVIVGILANVLYNEWQDTDRLAPPSRTAGQRSD